MTQNPSNPLLAALQRLDQACIALARAECRAAAPEELLKANHDHQEAWDEALRLLDRKRVIVHVFEGLVASIHDETGNTLPDHILNEQEDASPCPSGEACPLARRKEA